jgi:hypothetical protein
MLARDDRSHFAEPCLSNARHRHRIWVRVYGGACDGMDGPAAQQYPYRVMAAWRHGSRISSSPRGMPGHNSCSPWNARQQNGRPINGLSACQTAPSRAGSDSHRDAMQSLSIAPIFAPWAQEKPSYAVRDSDSGNMHFWPERRAQTGAQAGAGWLHNARVGLQPREEGPMAIRRARARAQVAARSGRKA